MVAVDGAAHEPSLTCAAMDASEVVADLAAEQQALDAVLSTLGDASWDLPTPAAGWTVRDQVSHLAFSEELAALAASDRSAFEERLATFLADLDRADREPRERGRGMTPAGVLDWWRIARSRTLAALERLGPPDRVPWVVGDMGVASFATARLMETWAHGQDVVDAIGADRLPTARLRHVADLGVRTRAFSYRARGLDVPDADVQVQLTAPDGSMWSWGPLGAPASVTGPALDFCLVVTQRRHPDDVRLDAAGPVATQWLTIAQAFAGKPGEGRRSGQFRQV